MKKPSHPFFKQFNGFSILFCSDWQYPWTPNLDDKKPEDTKATKALSAALINVQKQVMSNIYGIYIALKRPVSAIISNGDLTAFGHGEELDKIKEIWGKNPPAKIYLGLGNHDYANNVNDTFENLGAARMIEYLREETQKIGITNLDFVERPGLLGMVEYSGSLAYSWDMGNVHFVQLNNYPIYETSFRSLNKQIAIRHSLDWLEGDLAVAAAKGQAIILNYHDSDEHWKDKKGPATDSLINRFSQMLIKYGVSAVFVGHYHKILGKDSAHRAGLGNAYGNTPVFYCGSASQRKFLGVGFQGNDMVVEKIDYSKQSLERTPDGTYRLFTGARGPLRGKRLEPRDYQVRVYTGDQAGAGTDSNIYLTITGTAGQITDRGLNSLIAGNAFERNQTDTLTLKNLPPIGEITGITVRSDNRYAAPGWFLGWIEISSLDIPTCRFNFNKWVESPNLTVTSNSPQIVPPAPKLTEYTIRVCTGDKTGAGTDSNIFVTIFGASGQLAEQRLNGLISGNAFERNQTDSMVLKDMPIIGAITGVTVRSDNAYSGSAWYLAWIEISSPGVPTRRFDFNAWVESPNLSRTIRL
jgi:cytolysin (calcineurin-like family phosphatase)